LRFILILVQILVFFTIITFAGQCTSPSSLKICDVSHIVPISSSDNAGDSYVYNTLTLKHDQTSKDCAQAFADYECSASYPTCDPSTNPGTTKACQSLCNDFVSKCNGQLAGVSRDNCASLPSTQCTSNSGSISSIYPDDSSKKLSGGAIAGIVIGVIIFVVIVIVIVFVVKGGVSISAGGGGGGGGDHERVESHEAVESNKNNKGKGREARESGPGNATGTATLSVKVNDDKKAKAPESPSPRLSMNAGLVVTSANPANEREAKIKEQLEALPEAHRKPPPPWGIYYTDDGDLYFWNSETDESSWEYPVKN